MNPGQAEATFTPVLGPVDRENFFDAQRRNRHATWRISALCLVAALVMGLPLTLVLTPLFYVVALLGAEILNAFSPLSPEFWRHAHAVAGLMVSVMNWAFNHKPIDVQALLAGLAALLLPGVFISLFLWLAVRTMFRRGGVGGSLLSLQARPPNSGDLKELQLADTAQEMSIAAGLPAPRLHLMDSWAANAAAVGTSPQDAHIIVSRRLVDELSREEMQAVLGHLIASIGNGDLRIAYTVVSVFETCGLLVTLLNAPFGPRARHVIWHMLRYSFARGGTDSARAAEAEAVASLLSRNAGMDSDDIDQMFDPSRKSPLRSFMRFVFFPIFWTNMAVKLSLWFFTTVLLGPCIALLWRTRRYLADACAVQLTRNPSGLASALERLDAAQSAVPGAGWAVHLFIVGQGGRSGSSRPNPEQKLVALRAWQQSGTACPPGASSGTPPAAPSQEELQRVRSEMIATARAAARGDGQAIARMTNYAQFVATQRDAGRSRATNPPGQARAATARAETEPPGNSGGLQENSFLSFQPPLKRRLKRLARMGAVVDADAVRGLAGKARVFVVALWLLIGPLLAAAAGLMLLLIAMVVMANLLFLTLWMAAIHAVFAWFGHG